MQAVYFTRTIARSNQLWTADADGSRLISTINTTGKGAYDLTMVGSRLFMNAAGNETGNELWTSDGTPAGTRLVKDIFPRLGGSYPGNFKSFQGSAYFSAEDGVNGRELWKSDGTDAGTSLVKDINPGGKLEQSIYPSRTRRLVILHRLGQQLQRSAVGER
ncbi:ELWxxDGT repeat protein [Methylobacterium nonmethylotrophicum]|uniref:Uncharacterized protein n=1 Tax=Methylobacterium nonmethylotrophicum TaxID=1141884 RepID=A0A4Z0NGB1_9HYPH|nr:ELWxxDGT repeat protein [Methylobacterium nonmethylotrophicum]TGD95360.1 hypothetical protein EU555_28500 [Methylobacterium nonmethylotrophicum]